MSSLGTVEPGDALGSYEVEALLGSGGMANVYRVRHRVLGTTHALKLLTLSSRNIQNRLINEGRIQAHLRHPNVVAVTDSIDVDGSPGLVMEFVDGPDLDQLLGSTRLDLAQAHELGIGILEGVRAAHHHGSIHRDLKPANILIATDGGRWVPKIADFGLAKVLEDDASLSRTRSGTTMGTPAYMSPEQIRSTKDTDERTDVWAAGCILYELVTGRHAFVGDDPFSVMLAATTGEVPDPRSVVPDLPDPLHEAIRGALVQDRDERLPSIDALLEVWKGWTADQPAVWRDEALVRPVPMEALRSADTFALSEEAAPPRVVTYPSMGAIDEEPPGESMLPVAELPEERRRWSYGLVGLAAGVALLGLGVGAVGLGGVGLMASSMAPGSGEPVAAPLPPVQGEGSDERPVTPKPSAGPEPEVALAPAPADVASPAPAPVAVPAPAPAPEPVAEPLPTPVPVASPVPAARAPEPAAPEPPAPAPQAVSSGLLAVEGEGVVLLLRSAAGEFDPAEAPPGSYRMTMMLDSGPVEVGSIELVAGTVATLRCSAKAKRCVGP